MKSLKRIALGLTAAGALFGCGSSSSNDQGVSVTLYGFFRDDSCESGMSGTTVQFGQDGSGDGSLPGVLAYYGIQNNLFQQGIRLQRAFLDFFIEGATQQPPSTSISFSGVLGPNNSEDQDLPDGSLPPGFENIEPTTCSQNFIVTPDIMSWITLNRNFIPELPFSMNVRARITGLTTAGDRLETNELDVPVVFVEATVIDPDEGEGEDEDSGAATGEATEGSEDSESGEDGNL